MECSESSTGNAGILRSWSELGFVPNESASSRQCGGRKQCEQVDGNRLHILPYRSIPQRLLLGSIPNLRNLSVHSCSGTPSRPNYKQKKKKQHIKCVGLKYKQIINDFTLFNELFSTEYPSLNAHFNFNSSFY